MRDPLAPVIEGVDLSGIVNRFSFQCEPFFTDRNESQTMLDGSTVHDVFPLKARFSWTLNALSAEQYAALNAALRDTVTAQIFDPTINAVRSARFHVTRPAFVYNFTTSHYMSTDGSALILEDAAPRALPSVTPATRPAAANRDPFAPVFDGYDLSGMVNKYSFVCEPFTTDGDNAGTLQDGSTVLDVLANKFRLSWTLNAISAQQYADLCAVLSSGTAPDTVSASVYNPMLNATYTVPFHVTFPVFRFVLDNSQCMAYADSALTLEAVAEQWWAIDDTGTLSVRCRGDMPDYYYDDISIPGVGTPPWYHARDTIKSVIIDNSVTSIGEYAFCECDYLESVAIPDSVTSIREAAFESCPQLTSVTLPANLTEIEDSAFANCDGLISVSIPNSLKSIPFGLFQGCSYLEYLVIPDSITNVDGYVCYYCFRFTDIYYGGTETQWNNITISPFGNDTFLSATVHYNSAGPTPPAEVTWTISAAGTLDIQCPGNMPDYEEGGSPWYDSRNSIRNANIQSGVTHIGDYAFSGCLNLISVTIPTSVTSIGTGCFKFCELTSVTIPTSVTSIGDDAFYRCTNLISVTIPGSVTTLGNRAFISCIALENVTISDGLTSISNDVFQNCVSMKSIIIPVSVVSVGDRAFRNCKALTDVYYGGTESQWNSVVIGRSNDSLTSAAFHYNSSGPVS